MVLCEFAIYLCTYPPNYYFFFQSSNGVYVGAYRIPPNKPYAAKDTDIIGIGWISEASLADIKNEEKFVFQLCRENNTPMINKIKFQKENDIDELEVHLNALHRDFNLSPKIKSPTIGNKLSLKRKIQEIKTEIKEEKKCRIVTIDDDVVNLLSDSENEFPKNNVNITNNIKSEALCEEPVQESYKDKIKCENDYTECEAFNVKQEYFGYDDEPIKVDSDSDSESEHWYLRLSQSSPGKPFIRKSQDKVDAKQDDSSYSQMDDDFMSFGGNHDEEEEYLDDIISIPVPPKQTENIIAESDNDDFEDIISLNTSFPIATTDPNVFQKRANDLMDIDEVDACSSDQIHQRVAKSTVSHQVQSDSKKAQMIQPQVQSHKTKSKELHSKSYCYLLVLICTLAFEFWPSRLKFC